MRPRILELYHAATDIDDQTLLYRANTVVGPRFGYAARFDGMVVLEGCGYASFEEMRADLVKILTQQGAHNRAARVREAVQP